ncbi:MAG: Sjogren's syndrome/scleroderma autoantigen 1 family protein [Promethearchaeota archaeon]
MPDEEVTRRMGKLLRKGAAILDKACPTCDTPLLRLPEGLLYCAKCNVRYSEEKEGTAIESASAERSLRLKEVLAQLTSKILVSIDCLCQSLREQPHLEEIKTFAAIAKDLVETLKIIRSIQT